MNDNTAVMAAYGLQKAYGACRALDGVNMQVRRGDVYGLVGRNGAGKTTLMRMVTGQSEPSGGEMELFGASGKNMREQRSRTGVMIEIPSFSPFLTARENLEYYRLQRGIPGKHVVDEVLEQVDLTDTGKKKFKAFSLGMKQRLGLALALMNHPDFLILDEPINGLDPEGIREMRELLLRLNRERGLTILVSSHILGELSKIATRYGIIQQGRMVEQITAGELAQKCTDYLHLRAEQPQKAAALLERALHLTRWEMRPEGEIRIHEMVDGKAVGRVLAEAGISVEEMGLHRQDLEEYFLERMGGADHVSF